MRLRLAGPATALALCLVGVGITTASAAPPPLRITSLRVTTADGRTPVAQPLARGRRYAYRLDYRVGGRFEVRIGRRGTWLSPYGDVLEDIAPPSQLADPGRLFATGPIRVAAGDSPGEYQLRYSVTATSKAGTTTRQAVLRVRFR